MPGPSRTHPRTAFIRPFTTHVVNPVTRRFAGHLPGFGIITYRGRTSGRTFHTPVNAFRRDDAFVFALTYGSDVQWVKNILAQGGADLQVRGRTVRLVDPQVFVDSDRRLMPPLVRFFLGLIGTTEFLRMRIA